MKTTKEILTALSLRGYKKTKVREAIIAHLNRCKLPADAGQIKTRLVRQGLDVNKTTVYRELAFLVEQGVVAEVHFNESRTYYEIAGLPHHHHIVCLKCKKVEDVEAQGDLDRLEQTIEREKCFVVKRHSLEFFGLCPACR